MRTKLFGRLLPLALLCTAPQTGCSDLFASYLRFDDPGDGGASVDGGEPADLLGLDLTGVDLTGTEPVDMIPPPVCTQWSTGAQPGANDPWMSETEIPTGVTGMSWSRIAIGDFDRNGLMDIALATNSGSVSTGNVSIQVLLQTAPCTFDPAFSLISKTNYGLYDFRAIPINTRQVVTNAQWDIGLLGAGRKLLWCHHVSAKTFDCIDSDVSENTTDVNSEKRLIVDERGRTQSDAVVIHQKDTTVADFLVRATRNGATYTATRILPAERVIPVTMEPGMAVASRFNADTTAIAFLGHPKGQATEAGIVDVYRYNGTLYASALSPAPMQGTLYPFESYLYSGRFTNDEFDDIISIPKPNQSTRATMVFEFKAAGPAQVVSAGNLNLTYSRDLLAVNDLDSNGIDELNVVTSNSASSFQVYRYTGGVLSRVGNIQNLSRTLVAYSVGRLSAGHTRPDLVYTDGTKIFVRRANPNFMP